MNRLNETENLTYTSIDHLMNELDEVGCRAIGFGVSGEGIASYITAETRTLCKRIRTGQTRTFEDIYNEFIDELISNGRYCEYEDFLKNTKLKHMEAQDVLLP